MSNSNVSNLSNPLQDTIGAGLQAALPPGVTLSKVSVSVDGGAPLVLLDLPAGAKFGPFGLGLEFPDLGEADDDDAERATDEWLDKSGAARARAALATLLRWAREGARSAALDGPFTLADAAALQLLDVAEAAGATAADLRALGVTL